MSKKVQVGSKKPQKKAALGRGLGSLLGDHSMAPKKATMVQPKFKAENDASLRQGFIEKAEATQKTVAQVPKEARVWKLAIDKVEPNPNQPRKHFEPNALKELSESIRQKGIFQPIVVRETSSGKYQIIAGERRWRAAQMAQLHEIPALIKNTEEQNALELALIENIQREDLNPIEEAEAYSFLMKEYGLTQLELAEKVGKDRATVANLLRLLNLVEPVRKMVAVGQVSMGQAKVLLTVSDSQLQKRLAKKVMDDRLTVRQTEKLVTKWSGEKTNKAPLDPEAMKSVHQLISEMQKLLGTKVSIDYSKGKGRVHIDFYSDEELNGFVEKVRKAWQS